MEKFKERLSSIGRGLLLSVKEFPLEAALGLAFFIITIFAGRIEAALPDTDISNLFLWFFPLYVLLFTLHGLSSGRPAAKVLYVLSWFLWIPLLLWGCRKPGWPLLIGNILAVILLIAGSRKMDNESYARNILHTAVKLISGGIVGGVLMGIVAAIIGSVSFLFDLHLSDKWFSYPTAFIAFVIMPLLCCRFVSEKESVGKGGRLIQIVIDYILSPALVVYAAILYLYIIRICVHWELPAGGVAYLVLSFMAVALGAYLLRLLVEKRHFEWFYKALPLIAIPPLVLLWVGIFRRTGEYGLTETRFYLVILALLVTIFTAMLLKERSRSFQLMTLILAAAAILFTYIPGIRARDFGIRSQQARLEKLLPDIVQDGKLPEKFDYDALAKDSLKRQTVEKAHDVWSYLDRQMDSASFAGRYGSYGDFNFKPWKMRNALDSLERGDRGIADPGTDWRGLEEMVDLGAYTQFVPSSMYHYYEDSEVAVFYGDESKQDTLLICPVREKMEMTYSNGRYMAVFDRIGTPIDTLNAGYSFVIGHRYLFKKP